MVCFIQDISVSIFDSLPSILPKKTVKARINGIVAINILTIKFVLVFSENGIITHYEKNSIFVILKSISSSPASVSRTVISASESPSKSRSYSSPVKTSSA